MTNVTQEDMIARLATEVTRGDKPPSDDLRTALEQLVSEITTGDAGSRPVDWALLICDAVSNRHAG